MKVRHDNGPKRARPFVRKNSGSLIIHENVFFWEENNFSKNNRIFFGQSVFGFGKNTLGTTTCEILGKILGVVLKICHRLQINIFVSKFKNFFSKSPNGSIRKVNQLESIFQHFLRILPITGHPEPRLRFFFDKKWNRSFRSFYQVWNLGSTSYCILW